jgi:hypothetical protein
MQDIEAIKAKIKEIAISQDEAMSDEKYPSGAHIALVFEDGEISSTKAGSLLGMRTLHCFHSGDESKAVPVELFPYRMNHDKHGFVYCNHDKAKELRALIIGDEVE